MLYFDLDVPDPELLFPGLYSPLCFVDLSALASYSTMADASFRSWIQCISLSLSVVHSFLGLSVPFSFTLKYTSVSPGLPLPTTTTLYAPTVFPHTFMKLLPSFFIHSLFCLHLHFHCAHLNTFLTSHILVACCGFYSVSTWSTLWIFRPFIAPLDSFSLTLLMITYTYISTHTSRKKDTRDWRFTRSILSYYCKTKILFLLFFSLVFFVFFA